MTIRSRLTLWFSSILFVALVAMAVLSYFELVAEPQGQTEGGKAAANEETDENGMSEVLGVLLWCGLPALALSIGGGWWMMRKALAPVTALTQAAGRISEINLGERLARSRNGDEFDRLTEVFNAMTERLEKSFQRVREFTLHASHELKTPLTILRGEAESALSDQTLNQTQRARIESELDELERLTRIVDGLTLLTKADANLIHLQFRPVALAGLVQDCFADTQILAQASGLTVELPVCEQVTVEGEPHRLRQLLLNLADNAVKYNKPAGRITMALYREGVAAEFSIANTGPGIPSETLPRVFEPFFRGDLAHGHQTDGCGLGLSIAQWIVSVHKGAIRVDSVPAKLTTVVVRLPLLPEQSSA